MSEYWLCRVCGTENLAEESICKNCSCLREEPSYDQIEDEEVCI